MGTGTRLFSHENKCNTNKKNFFICVAFVFKRHNFFIASITFQMPFTMRSLCYFFFRIAFVSKQPIVSRAFLKYLPIKQSNAQVKNLSCDSSMKYRSIILLSLTPYPFLSRRTGKWMHRLVLIPQPRFFIPCQLHAPEYHVFIFKQRLSTITLGEPAVRLATEVNVITFNMYWMKQFPKHDKRHNIIIYNNLWHNQCVC